MWTAEGLHCMISYFSIQFHRDPTQLSTFKICCQAIQGPQMFPWWWQVMMTWRRHGASSTCCCSLQKAGHDTGSLTCTPDSLPLELKYVSALKSKSPVPRHISWPGVWPGPRKASQDCNTGQWCSVMGDMTLSILCYRLPVCIKTTRMCRCGTAWDAMTSLHTFNKKAHNFRFTDLLWERTNTRLTANLCVARRKWVVTGCRRPPAS